MKRITIYQQHGQVHSYSQTDSHEYAFGYLIQGDTGLPADSDISLVASELQFGLSATAHGYTQRAVSQAETAWE